MANLEPITIPIDFPSSDEPVALAQLLKRIDFETVHRFASPSVTYSGRSEGDVMWSAVNICRQQLAESGFAPR
jgi:hypothetical protein